jgi:hypothetical protein
MDDFMFWLATSPLGWIVTILGALVGLGVISLIVKAPGLGLQKKFEDLGELKGLTFQEIENKVGPPGAISAADGGKTVRQWLMTGFHIALVFDEDNICEGISHQSSV